MITRYDLIIDLNLNDDAAMMHQQEHGEYVKHEDAIFIINQLKDGLRHLKGCNASLVTPQALNIYVSNLLESVE